MADRLVLQTEARGEDKAARHRGAGGRKALLKAQRPKGVLKLLPDGSERP
jgi:hypothetical protein